MEARIEYDKESPEGMKAFRGVEAYVRSCGLEHSLLELVKVRASLLNGCAHCLDMHWKDARVLGETEQRLYGLAAWHETPYYTERERAALAWTDAITLIGESHAPDDVYEQVHEQFNKKEIVDLTLAIIAINGYNRLAIGCRKVPGSYDPGVKRHR